MIHAIRAPDLYTEISEGENVLFNKENCVLRPGYANRITYIRIHNLEDKKGIIKLYYTASKKTILTAFLDKYGIFEMPLHSVAIPEYPIFEIYEPINVYSEIKGTINIVRYWG